MRHDRRCGHLDIAHYPPRLNRSPSRLIASAEQELPMLALYIILGFVAVLALINFIEFGRVD
jgi:hypothetical protein